MHHAFVDVAVLANLRSADGFQLAEAMVNLLLGSGLKDQGSQTERLGGLGLLRPQGAVQGCRIFGFRGSQYLE